MDIENLGYLYIFLNIRARTYLNTLRENGDLLTISKEIDPLARARPF